MSNCPTDGPCPDPSHKDPASPNFRPSFRPRRIDLATLAAIAATLGMHAGTTPDDTMVLRAGNDEGGAPRPATPTPALEPLPSRRYRNHEMGSRERARRLRRTGR